MHLILNLFWNPDEGRFRAFWRILGQFFIYGVLALLLESLVEALARGMLRSQTGITPGEVANLEYLQEYIFQTPILALSLWIALMVATFASVWLAARLFDLRPFADFGFHFTTDWWIDFTFGIILGAGLITGIFLVELASGWVTIQGFLVTGQPRDSFMPVIMIALGSFVTVGFSEELLYRGYQLQNLAEGLNGNRLGPHGAILGAVLLSSIIFGAIHYLNNPNSSLLSGFNIALIGGFLLATGYLLTGELSIPIGVHIGWNFFQGNVYGFPVSGQDFGWGTFIGTLQSGPVAWTGGAFGPEGGLLSLGAAVLGGFLIILWVRRRYGRVSLYIPLAEAPDKAKAGQVTKS
jgi:membrane protease YdiL (CAAX protease family)